MLYPVKHCKASQYLCAVFRTMSAGNEGAGGVFDHACALSQSRTNCLSNAGGRTLGWYLSAGQKRDESGVNASSIQTSVPFSSRPNSNLVSAIRMPRVCAYAAASVYN